MDELRMDESGDGSLAGSWLWEKTLNKWKREADEDQDDGSNGPVIPSSCAIGAHLEMLKWPAGRKDPRREGQGARNRMS